MDVGIVNDSEAEMELRDIIRLYDVQDRDQARQRQAEIMLVVESLGGDGRAFRRERARASRAIVAEFYSPPRIGALAKEMPGYGIAPGLALDLTTTDAKGRAWDFSKVEMRREAERLFDEQKPTLLVGSPMCTAFSTWQYINDPKRDPEVVAREKESGKMHLAWMCKMYERQLAAGECDQLVSALHLVCTTEDRRRPYHCRSVPAGPACGER